MSPNNDYVVICLTAAKASKDMIADAPFFPTCHDCGAGLVIAQETLDALPPFTTPGYLCAPCAKTRYKGETGSVHPLSEAQREHIAAYTGLNDTDLAELVERAAHDLLGLV